MLPNMYYRAGVMELGPLPTDPNEPKRKKMFDLMNSLTIPLVMDDTDAILRYIDGDKAASKGAMGTVGYCMSGQYAIALRCVIPIASWRRHRSTARGSSPTRPTAPISPRRRPRPSSISAAPRHDTYAPMEMVEKLEEAAQDRRCQSRGRNLSGRPPRLRIPAARGLRQASRRAALERLLSLYSGCCRA